MACLSFPPLFHGVRTQRTFWFARSYCATELGRWQRRCDRLTQLQRRIRFAALETITAGGRRIALPLPAVEAVRAPSRRELEYLAGFFDGDGCVSITRQTGAVSLSVGQNVDSADVLLHFRSVLGGGVYASKPASGSRKAMLQWKLTGVKMTTAAAALGTIPSMKQAQLLIAADGNVARANRPHVEQKLHVLKQRQHVPSQWSECLWPYFAGFFDAEGSINVDPRCTALCLELTQVNPCMLAHLLQFLHENRLRAWRLCNKGAHFALACKSLHQCKRTLKMLLENGLHVKQKQAELAIGLTTENHLWTRDEIFSLKGWQSGTTASTKKAQPVHQRYSDCKRRSPGRRIAPCFASSTNFVSNMPCKSSCLDVLSSGGTCGKPCDKEAR